ncbi:MAG TPA: MBL fold metallo-hydrolase [Deltaproteobacteria bacterium]|nr:MBL fold metallo-hydrolase [Deltaproteobacteria bacterium]HPR55158.1 MBL fold metallo-hydrolase [Deltaproteobacteria bacterium]HXK47935.1 MBL fold metallo-hydrolase [Deltaproteobacteria bacterium]
MVLDRLSRHGIRTTGITDRIHVVHGNNRGRSPFCNVFLILDTVNVLFDTGCGVDLIEKLCSEVRIDRVFVSHSHLDHTAGCRFLQDSGSEIMASQENSDSIATAELLALRFVGEELRDTWMETYPPLTGFRDFTVSETYSHGQEFSSGHLRFTALYTPGHLNDHYCFWMPDEKILLGFDIDLSPFGPWYGNPESDISLFRDSIARVMDMPAEVYLPAHARPIRNPYIRKRLHAFAAFFDERDRQILDLLAQAEHMGIEDLVRHSPFYDADHASISDELLWFGEEQMIRKHLEGLADRGLVHEEGDRYWVRQ